MRFEPKLYKLSNGMAVIFDNMPEKEITDARLVFFTGARDEKPNEYGLTHFCEHMLCKGTKRFPSPKQIDEYFEYNAGYTNAGTSIKSLRLDGYIISENINLLVEFFADQIQNSLFDNDKIEIDRGVILDELRRAKDNEGDQFMSFWFEKLFNLGIPSFVLGTEETIKSFTRDQMLEFLSRRLSAKNALLVVSGKISDPQGLLKAIEQSFAFLPSHEVPENKEIHYTPTVANNLKTQKQNVRMAIWFPEKFKAVYSDLFKEMCVGRFRSYLGRQLKEVLRRENGLVYSVGLTNCGNEEFGLSGISTSTGVQNVGRAVALMARTSYDCLYEKPITQEFLDRLVKSNRLADATFLESSTRRMNSLINWYRAFGGVYEHEKMTTLRNTLTAKDVIDNAQDYFDGEMSILTQGPEFEGDLKAIWQENFKPSK